MSEYNLLRDGDILGMVNEKQLADTCITLAGGGFNAGETVQAMQYQEALLAGRGVMIKAHRFTLEEVPSS